MHMKTLPLLVLLMAMSMPMLPVNAAQIRTFSDIAIYPYLVGKNVSFTYTFNTFQTETISFSLTLTCGPYTNVLIYTRPSTVVALYLKDTVTLPGGFLPSPTASIKLTASGTGFTVLKTLNLTAKSRAVIDPGLLTNGTYASTGKVAAVTTDGTLVYYTEMLQFSGFQTLYEADAYHRLVLPDLAFSYQNGWTYSVGDNLEAELYFEDPFGLFPNLPLDNILHLRHLNGRFTKKVDGLFHFSVTDPLYVDPATLMMSLTLRPGYTATSFLYFPKNHFSELRYLNARLQIGTFGFNELSLDFHFSHDAAYPFFGSCASSAYCVVVSGYELDLWDDDMYEEMTHA